MDVIENIRFVPDAKQRANVRLASHCAKLGLNAYVTLSDDGKSFLIRCSIGTLQFKTEKATLRAMNSLAQ